MLLNMAYERSHAEMCTTIEGARTSVAVSFEISDESLESSIRTGIKFPNKVCHDQNYDRRVPRHRDGLILA